MPHTIRYAPVMGKFKNIHANSLGKALLSVLNPALRAEVLENHEFTRYNGRMLTSTPSLQADLSVARERG